MPQLSRIDRVRGCLLGLAVGDALGAPLEGLTTQQIKTHYGRVKNYVDGVQAWKRKPYRWRMRGLYSDDTQQALALCDNLLEFGRVDQRRLAESLPRDGRAQGGVPRRPSRHRPQLPPGPGRPSARDRAALERPDESGHRGRHADRAGGPVLRRRAGRAVRLGHGSQRHDPSRRPQPQRRPGGCARRPPAGRRARPRDPSLLLWVASDVARDEARIADDYGDVVLSLDRHPRSLPKALAHAESILDLPRDAPCPRWPRRPTATAPSPTASAPRWASLPPASPPASTSC